MYIDQLQQQLHYQVFTSTQSSSHNSNNSHHHIIINIIIIIIINKHQHHHHYNWHICITQHQLSFTHMHSPIISPSINIYVFTNNITINQQQHYTISHNPNKGENTSYYDKYHFQHISIIHTSSCNHTKLFTKDLQSNRLKRSFSTKFVSFCKTSIIDTFQNKRTYSSIKSYNSSISAWT